MADDRLRALLTPSGTFDWVLVTFVIVHVAAAAAAAIVRVDRRWAFALLVLSLLPIAAALGSQVVGAIVGMIESSRVVETLKAPTPKDLAGGVWVNVHRMTLALCGLAPCAAAALAALIRSRPPVRDASSSAAAGRLG